TVRVARAFPLVLLALLPLAVWALLVRVDQHGLTPFRVVRMHGLLCLAVLSVAGIARWARGRSLSWEVPAAVLVFSLAAAFGPTGAVDLSIASQSRLLERRLRAAGVAPVVAAGPSRTVVQLDPSMYRELEDNIAALA